MTRATRPEKFTRNRAPKSGWPEASFPSRVLEASEAPAQGCRGVAVRRFHR